MSAFFVMSGVIDDVVALQDIAPEEADAFGQALWAYNAEAVKQRYRLDPAGAEVGGYLSDARGYTYQAPETSQVQRLKSLNCWLYQCAEGDVPETKLYKAMAEQAEALELEISKGRTYRPYPGSGEHPYIPGYDDAKWDRARTSDEEMLNA